MNPFYTAEMSGFLRKPDIADLRSPDRTAGVRASDLAT